MTASPWLHSRAIPAICPKCNAPALHRSHAQTRFEQKRKHVTGKRPFRCHVCGWRGWFEELELRFPSSAKKPLPPEVAGRDVPIPDFVLDDAHRPQPKVPASNEGARPVNGTKNGINLAVPAAAPENVHSRSGKEARGGPLFAVMGMEIPEQQDNSSDSRSQGSGMPGDAAPGENAVSSADAASLEELASYENLNDAASRTEKRNGTTPPGQEPTAARQSSESEEMTVRPPEFDERSGLPVSSKVTQAFHHHARNKSWSCPKCGEFALYRSRARTIGESIMKKLSRKRPFRCHRCGWRGWLTR